MARAELIEDAGSADTVTIGCEVEVAEDGAEPERFRIVGSAEADPAQGLISNESPLGRALLGKRRGEYATFETPTGSELTFKTLRIA